jgi:hypothetical protein
MDWTPSSVVRLLFDSRFGPSDRFLSRWIFLRALGLIYFSAFFPLAFQIHGLIGPTGILPASEYLKSVAEQLGYSRYWYVPTVLWFSSGSHMLNGLCWIGMAAAVLLVLNIWPRGMLAICFVCFLSFVSAAREFSGYQSDGMLLEAGFLSLFFAPKGFRPGLAATRPPIRAAFYLLLWEWFRIYFESGLVKLAGGDPSGAISRRWTTIIRMARCPLGLVGTSSICRTGFTQQRHSLRWPSNSSWSGLHFCRGRFELLFFLWSHHGRSASFSLPTTPF